MLVFARSACELIGAGYSNDAAIDDESGYSGDEAACSGDEAVDDCEFIF